MTDPDNIDYKEYTLETIPLAIEVSWDAIAPPGICFQTHKFSILDSIEHASNYLRTDPGEHLEQLIIGFGFARILATLPHFVAARTVNGEAIGLLPKDKGRTLLGSIGRREIWLDTSRYMDTYAYLTNGTGALAWLKVINLK